MVDRRSFVMNKLPEEFDYLSLIDVLMNDIDASLFISIKIGGSLKRGVLLPLKLNLKQLLLNLLFV